MKNAFRGANYSFGACTPDFRSDFRDFKDFGPDFRDFGDLEDFCILTVFRPDFKEFRSGLGEFSDLKSGFMDF